MDLPADIEEALALAGGNRRELKAVLRHYRQDSLKFRGCLFPDRQYALALFGRIADIACTVMRKIRIYVISGDSTGLS